MDRYNTLKKKWEKWDENYPGLDNMGPARFYIRLSGCVGSGPCLSDAETTLVFDDSADAIAFIRYRHMPFLLDAISGVNSGEENCKEAEFYLDRMDKKMAKPVKALIFDIDETLKSGKIKSFVISNIMDDYNAIFCDTEPKSEAKCWGSLPEILTSDCLAPSLGEKSEPDETDEAEKPGRKGKVRGGRPNDDDDGYNDDDYYMEDEDNEFEGTFAELKSLIDNDEFDDNNVEHISLAKEFLESLENT
ncbi:MAG: hypothetical protein LLG37_06600 [Spirochaetia bacterium]|nr:hypothetical protein [Spirochaetia bacterium]